MLNARRRFLAAAYAPVLNNVVAIALFLVLPHVVTGGGLTIGHVARSGPLVLILGLGTTAGIVLMGLRIAEVDEQPVAEIARDIATEIVDDRSKISDESDKLRARLTQQQFAAVCAPCSCRF